MDSRAWSIDEGITDPVAFFRALPEVLPEATHLEVEGERIAPEVRALYAAHGDRTPLLSSRQSLGSGGRFRCAISPAFLDALSRLAVGREPAGLLDHLAVYAGSRQLLSWHDAFANAIEVGPDVTEECVRALATRFHVAYDRW